MNSKIKFRIFLFSSSFLLPLITGFAAATLKLENGWNGQQESFSETFFNYAIPIPVAAGCFQIFCWPLTIGVMIGLSFIENIILFILSLFLYYIVWLIAILEFFSSVDSLIFIIPNLFLTVLALLLTKPFKNFERGNDSKKMSSG